MSLFDIDSEIGDEKMYQTYRLRRCWMTLDVEETQSIPLHNKSPSVFAISLATKNVIKLTFLRCWISLIDAVDSGESLSWKTNKTLVCWLARRVKLMENHT